MSDQPESNQTTLNNLQEVEVQVAFTDDAGRAVSIDGPPRWQANDETLIEVDVAEDGRSAIVRTLGGTGSTFVTVSADAQLGDGVRSISGAFDVTITESGDVRIQFSFGTPRNR